MIYVTPYLFDAMANFAIEGKNIEVVGVITTYISLDIWFPTSGIKCPHDLLKKLRSLFDKFDESHVMKIDRELVSLDPHSFSIFKDYLLHLKEL